MIIRKANLADSKKVYVLHCKMLAELNKKFDERYKKLPENELIKLMRKRNFHFLVAEDKGKIIGFINTSIHKQDEEVKRAYINGAFVVKEYRRQNIANRLLNNIIKIAKENNCFEVRLSSNVLNTTAIKTWPTIGFQEYHIEFRKKLK
jgi:ribosomal protein S18 acetylase RimI-like enzyme